LAASNVPLPRAWRPPQLGLPAAHAVLAAAVQHPDTVAHGAPAVAEQARMRESTVARRNDRRAARRMLLRAAMIGIGIACPVGIIGGVWVRSRGTASTGLASSAAPVARSAPAAQQGPSPELSAPVGEVAPAPAAQSASATESAPAASPVGPIEPLRGSAPARLAGPTPPATAIHSPVVALRPVSKTANAAPAASPPSPSATTKSKAAKAAASAPAPAPAPDHVRPLIF
jgi:hypothetical protein